MDKLTKELINSFAKDFPNNPLVPMADEEYGHIKGWIDTSNYALNWIISKDLKKGWPVGRVSLLVGDPSTGKTAVSISAMRDKTIDLIVYLDSEGGGADASFAEFLGADPEKILYSPVDTVEELKVKMGKVIDIIEKNKSTKKVLMVIDSISMISTEKELDPSKGCYMPSTIVPTDKGDKKISEIQIGDKVLTHLGEYKEVELVWKHSGKKEIVYITTPDETIALTPNHRLLVRRNDHLIWLPAEELTLKDKLNRLKDVGKYQIISPDYENTFLESGYEPVDIEGIEKITNNEELVYDLTVKDHKTYCVQDRIVGHNSDFGAKAKLTREYFRSYIRKIQKLNICALFTAHYTQNVGQMYGPQKVIAGGTILKFAPSLIVELSHNTKENEVEKSAKGASIVGLKAKILKSRLGTFGKQMEFELDLNKGLEPFSGLFNVLKDYGIIIPAASDLEAQVADKKIPARSTGWYTFTPWEYPELFEFFTKKIRKSGKFRESEFNEFSKEHENELINLYQQALDKATFSKEEQEDEEQQEINETAEKIQEAQEDQSQE